MALRFPPTGVRGGGSLNVPGPDCHIALKFIFPVLIFLETIVYRVLYSIFQVCRYLGRE